MKEERKKILSMIAEGKITVEEAEKLLNALEPDQAKAAAGSVKTILPEYLYVKVVSSDEDNVDVKVPLSLVRAGMKFTSLIPREARDSINKSMDERGMAFDINDIKKEDIELLIESLADMEVNVDSKNGDTVRVYCA